MANPPNQQQQQHQQQQQQQERKQRKNKQQQQQRRALEELVVAKAELTAGDTTGLVYVRSSPGAAFLLVAPRSEALRGVERKIELLKEQRQD